MKTAIIILITLQVALGSSAQDKPYYIQIPDTPSVYTAATITARLIDGLGFRYYWATEGLTEKDLEFRPSKDARTALETLEHIDGLTKILLNTVSGKPTISGADAGKKLSFAELRQKTLQQLQSASELLKKPGLELDELDMVFERSGGKKEYPFWNLVNGPISDALWHVGQVVSFRRSSGNPLPNGVNVLQGTRSEQ